MAKREASESTSVRDVAGRYLNRELSWVDFNRRVLAMAKDEDLPVLERLKFCSIWSSNLDEFFQVRVAGLKDELADGTGRRAPDGLTSAEQLGLIRLRVIEQYATVRAVFKQLRKILAREGITIVQWRDLDDDDRDLLRADFQRRVFPVLTPLAVDPGHPFPYISNLSMSLGVLLRDPESGLQRFARLKVPIEVLGRYFELTGGRRLVPLEQVIAANLDELFPGMTIVDTALFRVTRDADLELDRETDDLLSAVEVELRRRRFGDIVRLEIERGTNAEILSLLISELNIRPDDVYEIAGRLDLSSAAAIEVRDRPDLSLNHWEPRVPSMLGDADGAKNLFALLSQRDVLVHHPYVSFEHSVLELLRQSAGDPGVQAIKLTLYRTSGDGRIVESLIRAAESGKQVVVVVELKARFDEEANIEWARRLERAGVHVTYGLVGLKVHSKVMLIVRHEGDGLRRYCHIGTGNYNTKTARLYADYGLLTSDPQIGDDLSHLFNALTGYGMAHDYRKVIVAPHQCRARLVELVRNEAAHGADGRIIAKMNSLVDTRMIDELYDASAAGVNIDLVVRGISSLRPGVAGLSENIRLRSVLGRFLEHSRVYVFANGGGTGKPLYLIGSADLMPRNLDRRVEVLTPVDDVELQTMIDDTLQLNLRDDALAWELDGDGVWTKVEPTGPDGAMLHNSHLTLQQQISGQTG